MSSFTIPPLPGEPLLNIRAVAQRAGCTAQAIYNAVDDGKISAVKVAGRYLIAESEVDRFIREWPTRNRGVAARWKAYREWKHAQAAAQPQEAVS